MQSQSKNLGLSYMQAAQAQKHVTFNEALRGLDRRMHLSVSSLADMPPATANDEERFLVDSAAGGLWAGQGGKIAVMESGDWQYLSPQIGWIVHVADTSETLIMHTDGWQLLGEQDLQNLDGVGIGASSDATNRLVVAGDASLLTHGGAGHQLKLNKATSGDTASLLFQTGWSGRAEIGTAGSDDFEIKVSDSGGGFTTALRADAATGHVTFPSGASGLTPPEFGTGALVTTGYLGARNGSLVVNGACELGNTYNFPPDLNLCTWRSPNLKASVSFAGYNPGLLRLSQAIPVDPNRAYRMSAYLMQEWLAGDWSAYSQAERHSHSVGLICLDAEGQEILAHHHMRHRHAGNDSLTTLAAPLTPGDTSISLVDAGGWNETDSDAGARGVIIMAYKDAFWKSHSDYSRLVETGLFSLGAVDKSTNIVTLDAGFPASFGNPDDANGTWPAGTRIANSATGQDAKFVALDAEVLPQTTQWFAATGFVGGIDRSGTGAALNFAPGTVAVVPVFIPNQSNQQGGAAGFPDTGSAHQVYLGGVALWPEPLAALQKTASGPTEGAVEIKVPSGDFANGTVQLQPAARRLDAV